ncbi:MAG: Gfo/Idh/MocA family oxidoreductase [Ginsengibacter sp.]
MAVINVGIAGFGVAGKVMHGPFLKVSDQYKVVSVLERHKNDSQELFPEAKIVRSFDELLYQDIEMVIITTPNDTHFPYAEKALLKGKHVVLEKPFTITSVEALKLIELAKKENLVLSVNQNRRYVSDFITIKEILGKKLLGEIHEFEAHYDRYRPELRPNAWREEKGKGNGIFYDLGAHLIDQALYLFGIPKTITADIRIQRKHARVDDFFDVRLNYGFTRVILRAGMLVREPGPRYMIHGTKGSYIKFGEDPQEALLKKGILPVSPDWGAENSEIYGLLHTEIDELDTKMKYPSLPGNFGLFYINLYQTIIHDAELKEKPEHSYNTIRIIELAYESNSAKATIPCTNLLEVEYGVKAFI